MRVEIHPVKKNIRALLIPYDLVLLFKVLYAVSAT